MTPVGRVECTAENTNPIPGSVDGGLCHRRSLPIPCVTKSATQRTQTGTIHESDLRLCRNVSDVIQFGLPPGTDLCLNKGSSERSNLSTCDPAPKSLEIDRSRAREPDPLRTQQDSK